MLELRHRRARVLEVRIRHRRVLAHDVHAADLAVVGRVHDLDHGQARLAVELGAPELLESGAGLGVVHSLIVGIHHRDQARVRRPLHVVLPAQRVQPGAGAADLAGHQRERDQAAGVVRAVDVLRDAHAPEDHRAFGGGVGARHLADRLRGNAADRRHLLGREVLRVLF